MGFIESVPYLCMANFTITDIVNISITELHKVLAHTLEKLAETRTEDNIRYPTSDVDPQ